MTVSQTSRRASAPASACARRRVPFEAERHRDDADRERADVPRQARDDRCGARAGAAALSGGDEDHVGAAEDVLDLILGLLGRAPAEVRVGARAEPLRQVPADVELDRRLALLQLLDVRVDGDELDLRDPGLDHAVDGVQSRAADADDADDREVGGGVRARVSCACAGRARSGTRAGFRPLGPCRTASAYGRLGTPG